MTKNNIYLQKIANNFILRITKHLTVQSNKPKSRTLKSGLIILTQNAINLR